MIALLYKTKFPGYLHVSALKVSESVKIEGIKGYAPLSYTPEMLSNALVTSPYLFIPFNKPHSYILDGLNNIRAIIMRSEMTMYWFEDSISLGELYTAQERGIPMLCNYVNLGRCKPCDICKGYGAVDWVDNTLIGKDYEAVPSDRFIWASHKFTNFLIDNQWVIDYDGEEIIHPCPRCLGLGSKSVLSIEKTGDKEEIKDRDFDHHLMALSSRPEIIIRPYYSYGIFKAE